MGVYNTSIKHSTECSSHYNEIRKKSVQFVKKTSKIDFNLISHDYQCRQPMCSKKRLLESLNKFNIIAEYNIYIKNELLLYTTYKIAKFKLKNAIYNNMETQEIIYKTK